MVVLGWHRRGRRNASRCPRCVSRSTSPPRGPVRLRWRRSACRWPGRFSACSAALRRSRQDLICTIYPHFSVAENTTASLTSRCRLSQATSRLIAAVPMEGEVLVEPIGIDGFGPQLETPDQQPAGIIADVEMAVVIRQRRHVALDAVDGLGQQIEVLLETLADGFLFLCRKCPALRCCGSLGLLDGLVLLGCIVDSFAPAVGRIRRCSLSGRSEVDFRYANRLD